MDPGRSPAPDEYVAASINAVKIILIIYNEYEIYHTCISEINNAKDKDR
jgi:hypothetical protein